MFKYCTAATCAVVLGMLFLGMSCNKELDTDLTILHGEHNGRPYWNAYSGRYIYPPSFEIGDSTGLSVVYRISSGEISSEVAASNTSTREIWNLLEDGLVEILYEGLDMDGKVVHRYEVSTIKSPRFVLRDDVDRTDRSDLGIRGLTSVLQQSKVQHWLEPGGPDPSYQLWVHPSKLMGVLSQNMLFLSGQVDDSEVQKQAREVAINTAEFLLTLREPLGSPLSGWTHSYWDGVERGEHPIYMNQIMTLYPAEAAEAFLDLFDVTNDKKWFDAAIDIADTYVATQREDGTWPLLMLRETGEALNAKLMVPVSVITFYDRLRADYGNLDYMTSRRRAFDWILTNPVNTFAWEAQFEDTRPKQRYRNLSHREASGFAKLLFLTEKNPKMILLARQLMMFVEDQFVIWSHDDYATRSDWFRAGMKWNGNIDGAGSGKDWFLPAALEQYAFYTPIAGTTSNVIHAFCAGFEATGDVGYQMKARALAESLIDAQEFHGTGEIPTHLRQTLPEDNWLNNSTYSARTLVDATCL